MKSRFSTVVAVFVTTVMPFPVSASTVTLTYTGVVGSASDSSTSELDIAGLFGHVGASLAGDSYKAVYVYDTSRGANVNPPSRNYLDVYGGSLYGTQTPAISEKITIDGVTV